MDSELGAAGSTSITQPSTHSKLPQVSIHSVFAQDSLTICSGAPGTVDSTLVPASEFYLEYQTQSRAALLTGDVYLTHISPSPLELTIR